MSRFVPILKNIFLKSGFDYILRSIYTGNGTILCFHQIYPLEYKPELQKEISNSHFTPESLATVLGWFSRHGYTFVSMDDVPDLLRSNRKKFVALTFDDGYRDNLLYALPVLRAYKAPATIYVSAGNPEDNIVLWIFLLDRAIAESFEISYGDSEKTTLLCRTSQEKISVFSRLLDYALFHPSGQLSALKDIVNYAGLDITPYISLLLSIDELRELNADPLVTIGAHGMNHSCFAALSKDESLNQMTESKHKLEAMLGQEVRHFAYPYGGVKYAGAREFHFAAEAGYTTAVTLRHAHLFPAHASHLTALPRINIGTSVMNNPSFIRLFAHGFTAMKINRGRRIVIE